MVVKEVHFGHLQDEEVEELHEEHEEEFADAADLQEDGAGQQAEQQAGREVLRAQTRVALKWPRVTFSQWCVHIAFKVHIDLIQMCTSDCHKHRRY